MSERPPFFPNSGESADRDEISCILDDALYLTNWRGAEDAAATKRLGITHVLSVGAEFAGSTPLEGVKYWQHDVQDDEEQRDVLSAAFDASAEFIAAALAGGVRALVHCAAGISRSSTIVLAYLVARRGYTLREAFEHVHARRRVVWPNDGFMEALIQLERRSIALEQEQEQPAALTKKSSSMCLDEYQAWGQYDPNEYKAGRQVDRDGDGGTGSGGTATGNGEK